MQNIKCYIDQRVAQKMHYYVNSVEAEISGIGKSEIINGDIYIRDIKIIKQKCSGARTIIDEAADMMNAYEMVRDGEDINKWNVWWHSHNTMGVFWSGTDTNTIKEHANNGGFLISIVTNKKGEFKTRLDIFPKDISPLGIVTHAIAQDGIPTEILPIVVNDERKEVLEKFLKEKTSSVDEQIKSVEDWYKEKIDELNDEKNKAVKELEDGYYVEYGQLENELEMLSGGTVYEDEDLKEIVLTEVASKVEVEAPVIVKHYDDKYTKRDKKYYDNLFKDVQKDCKPKSRTLSEIDYESYGVDNEYPIGFAERELTEQELEKEIEEDLQEIRDYNKPFNIGMDK